MGMCCVLSLLSICLSVYLSLCLYVRLFVCLGLLATRNKCHLILMANVCATVGNPRREGRLLEYGPTGRMRNASYKYTRIVRLLSILLLQYLMHLMNVCLDWL